MEKLIRVCDFWGHDTPIPAVLTCITCGKDCCGYHGGDISLVYHHRLPVIAPTIGRDKVSVCEDHMDLALYKVVRL